MCSFKLFCYSDFPFLFIHKNFWKNWWKKTIAIKIFLSNVKLFFYSNFPFLYICENILKKLWKLSKLFCSSDFPYLNIHENILKMYGNKILYLGHFWVITQVFPSDIVMKVFCKIYGNKILYLSNFWITSSYFVIQISKLDYQTFFKILCSRKWKLSWGRLEPKTKFKYFEFHFFNFLCYIRGCPR